MKLQQNTTRNISSGIKFNCAQINTLIKLVLVCVLVWSYFWCTFSFKGEFSVGKIDNKEELIKHFWAVGVLETENVANAMLNVDRKDFCHINPYEDTSQEIGYNATISAPHMQAITLTLLRDYLKPGAKVLDVGSGSGYLSACMAVIIGNNGTVIGIDHIPELVKMATENVKKNHENLIKSGLLQFVTGDGRKGYSKEAPYDAIHVAAATENIPKDLLQQLKPGGSMLIPIGSQAKQYLTLIDKNENTGKLFLTKLYDVKYAPLVDKDIQLKGAI